MPITTFDIAFLKKPPIDHARANTPVYDMIRFWGRKPWNLVRKYIQHYTKEGDVVLDPFAGCGVVAIESLKTKRRTIYNDLNSYCRFIARTSAQPIDIDELKTTFDKLMHDLTTKSYPVKIDGKEKDITLDWVYSTKCPKCTGEAEIRSVVYTQIYRQKKGIETRTLTTRGTKLELPVQLLRGEDELSRVAIEAFKIIKDNGPISHEELMKKLKLNVRPEEITRAINEKLEDAGNIDVMRDVPIEIEYKCGNKNCENKLNKKELDKNDIVKIDEINRIQPMYFYPSCKLAYPNDEWFITTRRREIRRIDKLFTNRNLIALSILKNEIDTLHVKTEIKEALLLTFLAMLEHVSKMQRPSKKGLGVKRYQVPPTFLELNVLHVFANRKDAILKGKRETSKEIGNLYRESENVKEVTSEKENACFLNLDSRKLPLDNSSIDYVFTDPEYGDAIQYYELSLMGSSWLEFENDWEDEIVVNPKQGKTLEIYRDMLCDAFREVYRVLKPNKYMTVTFHSREIKYWNSLMFAIQVAGFRYVTAVYQIPQREYTNWLMARNPGEMGGDVYVTFYKSEIRSLVEDIDIDLTNVVQNIIVPEAYEIILLHNGQATFNQLVRGITLCLINKGLMHNSKIRDINYEKVFDEHFSRLGRTKIWRLKQEEKVSPLDFIPIHRRIEWIIFSVMNKNQRERKKTTITDFLSAIFTTLKNARTPENREILEIIRELAMPKQRGGLPYWEPKVGRQLTFEEMELKKPLPRKVETYDTLDHPRIIKVVTELGRSFGFDIWIGEPEIRKNPELKKYRTIKTLVIRGVDKIALKRLENVDIIFLDRKSIPVVLIEVEHTSNPREGLLRMSNIFEEVPHLNVKTITILPDKKALQLVEEIIREPSIKRLVGGRTVYYATYSIIAELADETEYRRLSLDDFLKICNVLEPEE